MAQVRIFLRIEIADHRAAEGADAGERDLDRAAELGQVPGGVLGDHPALLSATGIAHGGRDPVRAALAPYRAKLHELDPRHPLIPGI